KTGLAILNYERARWLAPGDPDIAANLRHALELAQVPLPITAWLPHYSEWCTLNCWAGMGATSLLLLTATLPLAVLLPGKRRVLRFARVLAMLMLLSCLTAIGLRWGELNQAVVIAKETPARISPVPMGQSVFTLREGAVISILKSHGSFTLVRAADGHQGWVNRDAIESIAG